MFILRHLVARQRLLLEASPAQSRNFRLEDDWRIANQMVLHPDPCLGFVLGSASSFHTRVEPGQASSGQYRLYDLVLIGFVQEMLGGPANTRCIICLQLSLYPRRGDETHLIGKISM